MFSNADLDLILDALHDQRDACEAAVDTLVSRGFDVMDPRRMAVEDRMTRIEGMIMKINGMGRA